MHYIPPEVQEIDKKLGDESMPNPASVVWDSLKRRPDSYTKDQIIDLFIIATERKNRTQKIEDLIKKAISELERTDFLFKFEDKYLIVQNQV